MTRKNEPRTRKKERRMRRNEGKTGKKERMMQQGGPGVGCERHQT